MSEHENNCRWENTKESECEFRSTHKYCPHKEHACTCKSVNLIDGINKLSREKLLEIIRVQDEALEFYVELENQMEGTKVESKAKQALQEIERIENE